MILLSLCNTYLGEHTTDSLLKQPDSHKIRAKLTVFIPLNLALEKIIIL